MTTASSLLMRDALVPIVGSAGYRRLLTAMYRPALLRAAGAPPEFVRQLERLLDSQDVESIPRQEAVLDSDSKSRVYVIQTVLDTDSFWTWVLKWYNGARQQQAPIESRMNAYFLHRLAPSRMVVPVLDVVPLSNMAETPLSVALMPYFGELTLYDRLHQLPRHDPRIESLLQQASDTLAYTQVLGRMGHEEHAIALTSLTPDEAPTYFLEQVDSALLRPFAANGNPLDMGEALLKHFGFFARVLGEDSSRDGLYYRGINPRNIMLVGNQQAEIDFEQDSLRSRFIDIVSLLENGLEMTEWDDSADYPAYTGQMAFDTWEQQRQLAQATLSRYNYLSHQRIEHLTASFIDTTWKLEQQHLHGRRVPYQPAAYRLILETARLFRHLQYVGYCKRNEMQTLNPSKRVSSRYRQKFHALWAKVALDQLIFSPCAEVQCLPESERQTAMALRHTLDRLPLMS
ncbi:MAG: hypothetical protein OEU26_04275 [Candidatus Tectomicrobia bacterium]|nr:hypothetical protein [Candidatus Tectomicrobia bacterium]